MMNHCPIFISLPMDLEYFLITRDLYLEFHSTLLHNDIYAYEKKKKTIYV